MSSFIVLAEYSVNKEYIARHLCENRNKPQMKCCGKCYLKKQLSRCEESGTSDKKAPEKSDKSEFEGLPVYKDAEQERIVAAIAPVQNPVNPDLVSTSIVRGIFRPPATECSAS